MTTTLPDDLMTFGTFSAEFALSPAVEENLRALLRMEGKLIHLPGQRVDYVSRADAFAALNEFVRRTGCGPALESYRKVQQHYQRIHKAGRR